MIMKSMDQLDEIDTQRTVLEIINRLLPRDQERWKMSALRYRRDNSRYPGYCEFMKFLQEASEDANDPVYGHPFVDTPASISRTVAKGSSFSTTSRVPCVVCEGDHRLLYCETFKSMDLRNRQQVVSSHGLCYNCLYSGHFVEHCRIKTLCGVKECNGKHNALLHGFNVIAHATLNKTLHMYMPVVNVIVNGTFSCYALLDTASTTSFCSQRLVNELDLKGVSTHLNLSTLNNLSKKLSKLVSVSLSSETGENSRCISCFVVNNIPAHTPPVDISKYTYLRGLEFPHDVQVDLLLGQDNAGLLVPFEVKHGVGNEPFATRTLYGWCLNGPVNSSHGNLKVINNFVDLSIDDRLDRLWSIDNEGIDTHARGMSREDLKVMNLWDRDCSFLGGHFEIPIPWKYECKIKMNNKGVANSRLNSLKRSLKRKCMYDVYDNEVTKLVNKGYAEHVPEDCIDDLECWYLPHHAVAKKNGSFRIVYDCANKFDGVSLNDRCLQGPNLNNPLFNVLLRFCEFEYAFMADVESMYFQVKVPLRDRDALRFLWYNSDGDVIHLRMTRHVFGGVWCASSSAYALHKSVDFDGCSDVARRIVRRSFYVDDCLVSTPSLIKTKEAMRDTRDALSGAGFHLTKYVSNDERILEGVPEDDRMSDESNMMFDECKALGVKWCVSSDEIYFYKNIDCANTISKRYMLKIVASVFDPLGLICPIIVQGRLLFQEANRSCKGWDDSVSPDCANKWLKWVASLKELQTVRIPRCIQPSIFTDSVCELHVFSDASQQAYGACAYIRCVSKDAVIHTKLICGKSKVVPMKITTIPRLELQAAVLAVRMQANLAQEMSIMFDKTYFWTDSKVVLGYIHNESRRFHVYVANRINVIREASYPNQWHHVPGAKNPADVLSRKCDINSLNDMWWSGPPFLRSFKDKWASGVPGWNVSGNDPEVKHNCCHVMVRKVEVHPIDALSEYFSSWTKLKRSVGWLLKIKLALKNKDPISKCMESETMLAAELLIIKHVQECNFSSDMELVRAGKKLRCDSPLAKLMPTLNNGLLTVGGRVTHADIDEIGKHPYILPVYTPSCYINN